MKEKISRFLQEHKIITLIEEDKKSNNIEEMLSSSNVVNITPNKYLSKKPEELVAALSQLGFKSNPDNAIEILNTVLLNEVLSEKLSEILFNNQSVSKQIILEDLIKQAEQNEKDKKHILSQFHLLKSEVSDNIFEQYQSKLSQILSVPNFTLSVVEQKKSELNYVKKQLVEHRIFSEIKTAEQLRQFMSWHVFAVWDFMSLIKRLQIDLTCTTLPWMPNKFEQAAHLVNEIVLGEESDILPDGTGYISHFALYLEAMKEIGADTTEIDKFINSLQNNVSLEKALEGVDSSVAEFVRYTIDVAQKGTTYEVLGSFFYGRENVIPDMFSELLNSWHIDEKQAPMFVYYLNRHIELDSGEHGPAAEKMIDIVTESKEQNIIQVLDCAIKSVKMRIKLWDAISAKMRV